MIDVVTYMHNMKLIHGDLTLENVLIGTDGHIVFIDFGSVLKMDSLERETLTTRPDYAAPDMIKAAHGDKYDEGVDWWALGVCAYRMLTLNYPFEDLDGSVKGKNENTKRNILHEDFTYPSFISNHISGNMKDLISGLLTKDHRRRLGYGKLGLKNLQDHPVFEGIDWNTVREKILQPPFIPDEDATSTSRCMILESKNSFYKYLQKIKHS
eukprot:TRINITY_DN3333_c0_g1_i1.p1 TRINITY_DN3333_c0_g1~~TRINITY_DN3333_c0_g1_i1.p1  ORF type:complete len:211 (+),score=23.67 TRINITY_DN3333_c0_g1_i1:342-974(+)